MRWTTAWLLALAAHVAVVALVWLCCRSVEPKPVTDSVELAVLEPPRAEKAPAQQRSREPVHLPEQVRDHGPDHAHGGVHVHVHGKDHGGVNEHVDVNEHVNVGVNPPVIAPGPARPTSPINLNLNSQSLAALAPPADPPSSASGAKTDTATLHGTITGDGSMHIRNKSAVTVGSDLTSPGGVLKDWLKDPKAHAAERDGTVAIVKGNFDTTDSIMRAAGQDPYRAQRMKMLDETREQRLTLAARDRTARREAELLALPRRLRNIWNDSERPAKERRQTIFQLWDECQESDEGEAEGAAAGAHARREIVLFIRERLGEGSPLAYPKEEITALNLARQSRQRFDPYGRLPL